MAGANHRSVSCAAERKGRKLNSKSQVDRCVRNGSVDRANEQTRFEVKTKTWAIMFSRKRDVNKTRSANRGEPDVVQPEQEKVAHRIGKSASKFVLAVGIKIAIAAALKWLGLGHHG